MEINELKGQWQEYDKRLTESLRLNEELLRKLNLDKSKREMDKLFNMEIWNIIFAMLLMILISWGTLRYGEDIKFLISYLVAFSLCIIYLILSIKRLMLLSKINYYNTPVVELQKSLAKFERIYQKFKKIELLLLMPIFAIAFIPIYFKAVFNWDVFMNPVLFGFVFFISLPIAYLTATWLYRVFYEKPLSNTNLFLCDLNKFEQE